MLILLLLYIHIIKHQHNILNTCIYEFTYIHTHEIVRRGVQIPGSL